MPHISPSDAIIAAIKDLSTMIATYAAVKPSFMPPIIDPILHELRTLAQMYQSATPIAPTDQRHQSADKGSDDDKMSTSQTAPLPRVESVPDTAVLLDAQHLALAALNLTEGGRPLTYALTKKSAYKKNGNKQKMRRSRAYSHHTQYGLFILKTNLLIAAPTQCTTILNRKKNVMLPVANRIASAALLVETVSIFLAPLKLAQLILMSSRSCLTRCLRTTQISSRSTSRIIILVLLSFDPNISKLVRSSCPPRPSEPIISRNISVMVQSSSKSQKASTDCLKVACWRSSASSPILRRTDTFNMIASPTSLHTSPTVSHSPYFGIKYHAKEGVLHLIATLQNLYQIKVDWTGGKYMGLTIDFDKQRTTASLSSRRTSQRCYSASTPSIYHPPTYGSHVQLATTNNSLVLCPAHETRVQAIVGSLLHYARAVDPTMLPAVTAVASAQANPTQHVLDQAQRLLVYAATYPNNRIVYKKSDMTLRVQSDASHLSRSHSRSVAGGLAYLVDADSPHNKINGSITSFSNIIDVVVASAAEVEYAASFSASQLAAGLRTILTALGHSQPPTTLLCDNACAVGLGNDIVKMRRSKSIDMRYHWIKD